MARLNAIDPDSASGAAKELLDAVKAKLGRVPNMMKIMATSPAVLQSYLQFTGAMAGGILDGKLREQIALLVAEANECDYCISAHSVLGKLAGLSEAEVVSARR